MALALAALNSAYWADKHGITRKAAEAIIKKGTAQAYQPWIKPRVRVGTLTDLADVWPSEAADQTVSDDDVITARNARKLDKKKARKQRSILLENQRRINRKERADAASSSKWSFGLW